MSIDSVSSSLPAIGTATGSGEALAWKTPLPPEIGAVELEHAQRWLRELNLLKHPSVAFLSPPARVALARIGIMKRAWAKGLLDSTALDILRYGSTQECNALGHALELAETLVRRNIDIAVYFRDAVGLLSPDIRSVKGTMAEMFYVAAIAEAEERRGYGISARVKRDVPWGLIPSSFLASVREQFPEFARTYPNFMNPQPITEVDAVVMGDRLVEIKSRARGERIVVDNRASLMAGEYADLLNPAKLFAIAKRDRLRGVEFLLSMETMDEGWGETIAEIAEQMEVGVRVLFASRIEGEPQVLLDTMRPQQLRGAALLFRTPELPPLPEQQEGLSPEERAWLAQWVPDVNARRKAAAKSRFFSEQVLQRYADVIARGMAEAVTTHYGVLELFELFDAEGQKDFLRRARFLADSAGAGSSKELLQNLVSFGLQVRQLTEDDEELARGLARLGGSGLRSPEALEGLGISTTAIRRIEGFIRKLVRPELQQNYLVVFPGLDAPVKLFNVFRLLEHRRSELPDDLAREIERALPEWNDWRKELHTRYVELSAIYETLPREHKRGLVKTRRQRIPEWLRRAEAEKSGDLGLLEAKIDELEEELGRLGARARSFGGVETEAAPAEEAVDAGAQAAEENVVAGAGAANNPDAPAPTMVSPSGTAPTSVVRPIR